MSKILNSIDNSLVAFLIGGNGSGKSRRLSEIASEAVREGRNVIAVSNTVFDRMPSKRSNNYAKLSPALGRSYAEKAFKAALCHDSDYYRIFSQIGKVLVYAGYEPRIFLEVRINKGVTRSEFVSRLRSSDIDFEKGLAEYIATILDDERAFVRQDVVLLLDFESSNIHTLGMLELVRNERALHKAKVLVGLHVHLCRPDRAYPLRKASSGELTVLASQAFISTHIKHNTLVLVDEPENSLHPKWQSDYCRSFLNLFYLYEPKLVIATHAPLVVSGAMADNVPSKVFVMPNEQEAQVDTSSIEALLMDVFGVLPPASHYLSERVSGLLNDLQRGDISLQQTRLRLDELSAISYDSRQVQFLTGVGALADEISSRVSIESYKNAARD